MDTEEFRQRGKEMVDYMCEYMETVADRPVISTVQPNYLRSLLPREAPTDPEPWEDVMADVENKIMPGITHWQHPRFHAYFPAGNSYPSILGDMLSDIIACVGFSWAASPACTELETIVLDWFGKAIGLPQTFLSDSRGGGVIQGSASECILVCMLAARAQALRRLHEEDPSISEVGHLPKLVAYCSREAHSCVEKAAMISLVQLRILEPDADNSLRGEILRKAIEEDEAKGLVPFFVSAIMGSTGSCSFDNLVELGPVAKKHGCWMHVDAAYAGSAFICPEFQHLLNGIEVVDSFNTNPNKWLLINFDCSCLWVKERKKLIGALNVDPLYLKHEHEDEVFDYRHWCIPLSRRFRSLKMWFVFRSYGISGLQEYIRNHVRLARLFENHVLKDKRFEIVNDVRMGLVCFRLRSEGDKLTADLLANINHSGKIHMIPARIKGKYIIRFSVNAQHATEKDIDYAWSVITEYATEVLTSPDISPRILCRIPSTPEGRKLRRQFSFTRSVSHDMFKRSASSLYDGATPIIIPDEDEDTNIFDEVFENAINAKEEENNN
uniref:Tyrosine decarboxylase n=1 Tax=Cuerna arida TaxID=1464854 RepID=A0A1B6G856_9HEMI